jgi:hypothetical protein
VAWSPVSEKTAPICAWPEGPDIRTNGPRAPANTSFESATATEKPNSFGRVVSDGSGVFKYVTRPLE